MQTDHRRDYHRAWAQLSPPLRPSGEVVEAVKKQIGAIKGRTILLGVTPEFADLADDLVAIERNVTMVKYIWPGNSAKRRVVVGDWRNSNFASNSFSTCIGDGSFCGLRFTQEHDRVLGELSRILRPGGRFVCRLYVPPNPPVAVSDVRDAAMTGAISNFHAFKFRLGMALAAQAPDSAIGVDAIYHAFGELFSDRAGLVELTGWSRAHIDTIDFYRGSNVVFNFPTREQVLNLVSKHFSNARLIPSGSYEMAELCPLLIAERN